MQLDPPHAQVGRDAAVVRGIVPPPLSAGDEIGHQMRGHALARAHQLLEGLGAPARAVTDVPG